MKTNHLKHCAGGKIEEIIAVYHETQDGIATWGFRAVVKWDDTGNKSAQSIGPNALYCAGESNPEARAECDSVMNALDLYLRKSGRWHDRKWKGDMAYFWTPKKPHGQQPIEPLIAQVVKEAA